MADFKLYFPILLKEEGGYSDDPDDHGGATKYGVTLAEWKKYGHDIDGDGDIDKDDVKRLSVHDAYKIAKIHYWDVVHGDNIYSQSVGEFIADWAYMSGPGTAIKRIQRLLGLNDDGIIGPITLKAINGSNPETLFTRLQATREAFFYAIVKRDPTQKKFLHGWLNRNNNFRFHG